MGVLNRIRIELELHSLHSTYLYTEPSHLLGKSTLLLNFSSETTLICCHLFYENKDQGLWASWTRVIWEASAWHPRALSSSCVVKWWKNLVSLESEKVWIHLGHKHLEMMINMSPYFSPLPCPLSIPFLSSAQFLSRSLFLLVSPLCLYDCLSLPMTPLHPWL